MTEVSKLAPRAAGYRSQAEEMRRRAAEASLPDIKQQWLELAEQFEGLARDVEQ